MNKLVEKISRFIGSIVPQALGRRGYLMTVRMLENKAQKKWGPKAKLWPRSSLFNRAFQPLVTSLDLSLFVPSEVSEIEWAEFRATLKSFKVYFPWLGTLSVYDLSTSKFLESANFFELESDKNLKDPLLITKRKPSKAEALVFLMKMIEGDWDNLVSRPLSRITKWQEHWRAISDHFEGFKDFEMKEVFNRILHFAKITGQERKNILQYLNACLSKKVADLEPSAAVWQFYPGQFSLKSQVSPVLRGFEAEILQASIAWEIWQMWSQRGDFERESPVPRLLGLHSIAEKSLASSEVSIFAKTENQIQLFLSMQER